MFRRNVDRFFSQPRSLSLAMGMLFLGVAGGAQLLWAQEGQTRARQNPSSNNARQTQGSNAGEVHLLPVQGNIYMLVGAGGNITVQAGDDGILLVDTGLGAMSDKVLEAIRPLSKRPLVYIINSDDLADHIGGNEAIGKTGRPVPTDSQRYAVADRVAASHAYIIAFQTVLDRMSAPSGQAAAIPEAAWPNDTYSVPQKNLYFNDEAVEIFHQPANTDGNSLVLFRRSDVVSAGDIFDPAEYPIIDLMRGGSLQGVIDGLNRLKQIVIPADHQEGGTMIIPGHGRLSDAADLAFYQQMVTIVRDRLRDMIKRGMTLEQVKAARPTRDYDPIYGSTTGNWTTDMFVEAAYKSLSGKQESSASHGAN
jgi:glyoxylase-like metal-dependent hydrolase (beta-lactamase superfamily II)